MTDETLKTRQELRENYPDNTERLVVPRAHRELIEATSPFFFDIGGELGADMGSIPHAAFGNITKTTVDALAANYWSMSSFQTSIVPNYMCHFLENGYGLGSFHIRAMIDTTTDISAAGPSVALRLMQDDGVEAPIQVCYSQMQVFAGQVNRGYFSGSSVRRVRPHASYILRIDNQSSSEMAAVMLQSLEMSLIVQGNFREYDAKHHAGGKGPVGQIPPA